MPPETEKNKTKRLTTLRLSIFMPYVSIYKYKNATSLFVCKHNLLCGHEEGLDDAVHEAGIPQVDQASLTSLRLPNLPQRTRGKWVGLGRPGTLIQHQLDLVFSRFWEILRKQIEMVGQRAHLLVKS